MSRPQVKDERMELRIAKEHKRLIEQAAALVGCSTGQFVASQAVAGASEVLDRERAITLTRRHFARFVAAVEADDQPTPAATQAAARFSKGHAKGPEYHWSSND